MYEWKGLWCSSTVRLLSTHQLKPHLCSILSYICRLSLELMQYFLQNHCLWMKSLALSGWKNNRKYDNCGRVNNVCGKENLN